MPGTEAKGSFGVRAGWAIGSSMPHRVRSLLARIGGPLLALLPLKAVAQWSQTITRATGSPPSYRARARMLSNWLTNNLMSLSLANWTDDDILRRCRISAVDEAKLHDGMAGPGVVLALPHMGSWDLAGAWCAQVGIPVTSVAEQLPKGAYERFRDARGAIGIKILPHRQREVMAALAADIAQGRMVCLLADRDLSARGIKVTWPGAQPAAEVSFPAGPALLAQQTGAQLRTAIVKFDGDSIQMSVSDPVVGDSPTQVTSQVAEHFSAAIQSSPSDWLMLQRFFRT